PSIVEPEFIQIKQCSADFVLLVEKGTQWNRLSEDKFWRRYNCVLRTGNGQAPRGVRRLARRLHEEHGLPVYVLVDNDPWGYYIYSVVKQGSINLAFESERMAIPKAKFIGLSSADPDAYGLPRNVGIKLNDKDISRAKELMKYRWFDKKPWQDEIKRMLSIGLKYELDALANKDFRYLTKNYLPRKLTEGDWLDQGRGGPGSRPVPCRSSTRGPPGPEGPRSPRGSRSPSRGASRAGRTGDAMAPRGGWRSAGARHAPGRVARSGAPPSRPRRGSGESARRRASPGRTGSTRPARGAPRRRDRGGCASARRGARRR